METLLKDLRYGIRMLRRSPGFTLVAVTALALCIGATSAVYTVVDAILFRRLPFPEAERVIAVDTLLRGEPSSSSYPDAIDFRDRAATLDSLAVWRPADEVLTGTGNPVHLSALEVTPSLLRTLRLAPALGRDFSDADAAPGVHAVLISQGLWSERFNRDPTIVGKTIAIDGVAHTVIGVLPRDFKFPLDPDSEEARILLPFPRTESDVAETRARERHRFRVVARLKSGVTQEQARANLSSVAAAMRGDHPDTDKDLGVRVTLLRDQLIRPVQSSLLLLLLAVGMVLLIGCGNVAGLLLARASARQREISIRAALGATRGRILRQLLTESALLAVVSAAAGGLLSLWLVNALAALLAPGLPRIHEISVNGRALGLTLGLAVLTVIIFGLWPALHAVRLSFTAALKEVATTATAGHRRARNVMLAGEITLSVVLMIAAGLSIRSFVGLYQLHPGFRPENLVVAQLELPRTRYGSDEQVDRYYREVSQRLASIPGVSASAVGAPLPFTSSDRHVSVDVPGQQANARLGDALLMTVSPDYFRAMGIPLIAGRTFDAGDDRRESAASVVVSDSFCRRLFGDAQHGVGRRVLFGYKDLDARIVGVVGDTQQLSLDQASEPIVYVAMGHAASASIGMGVVARGAATGALISLVRAALLDVDRDLPPTIVRPMQSLMAETIASQRALAFLLGAFGVLALLLVATGIYGVVSYTTTQRRREIGIRVALGARRRDVLLLVMGGGLRLAAVAIALGTALALVAGRLMQSLLYGVSTADWVTFAITIVTIFAVTALASFLPARLAAKSDPSAAFREP